MARVPSKDSGIKVPYEISIYIHIPFCKAKCIYCDFLSFSDMDDWRAAYVNALCADIKESSKQFDNAKVVTVFFGGGTPTALAAPELIRLLDTIRANYNMDEHAKISTEANPDTVDTPYLARLWQGGFNRISFGVQSFDCQLLKLIGRKHSPQKAADVVRAASGAGFDDINIDLMFSLPNQSLSDFAASLNTALSLPISHISCYALTVEENTPLANMSKLRHAMANENMDRLLYYSAKDILVAHGFIHYEISNWAKPGYECNHNLGYWQHRPYIGFGIGAHSFLGNRRLCKTDDFMAYVNGRFDHELLETLSPDAAMKEYVMLGLRLINGIDKGDFAARFGIALDSAFGAVFDKFVGMGLIYEDGRSFRLTAKGIDLSNTVFVELL